MSTTSLVAIILLVLAIAGEGARRLCALGKKPEYEWALDNFQRRIDQCREQSRSR